MSKGTSEPSRCCPHCGAWAVGPTGTMCAACKHFETEPVGATNDVQARVVAAPVVLTTPDEAIAAWEQSGPTSLTVALMADALYAARAELAKVKAVASLNADHGRVQMERAAEAEAALADAERRGAVDALRSAADEIPGMSHWDSKRWLRARADAVGNKGGSVAGLAITRQTPGGRSLTYCCCDRTTARLVVCPAHPDGIEGGGE